MAEIVGVRFKNAGKVYYFSPGGFALEKGGTVVVETSRGIECGEVVIPNRQIADDAVPAYGLGVDAMFSIDRAALPFPESAPRSAADYRATLRDVLRVWQLGRVGHSH